MPQPSNSPDDLVQLDHQCLPQPSLVELTRCTEPLVIVPTIWALADSIAAKGIRTHRFLVDSGGECYGATGRPTTGRPTIGSRIVRVLVWSTSGTVRVPVWPTSSIVRVYRYCIVCLWICASRFVVLGLE